MFIRATLTNDLTLTLTVDGKKMQVKVVKDKFTANKLEDIGLDFVVAPGNLIATRYVGDGKWYTQQLKEMLEAHIKWKTVHQSLEYISAQRVIHLHPNRINFHFYQVRYM